MINTLNEYGNNQGAIGLLPKAYPTYSHCQRSVAGILPIDYFLAKSLITDCRFKEQESDALKDADSIEKNNELASMLVFHAILQLSISLREGHTCLPLTELADKTVGALNQKADEHIINNTNEYTGYTFPHLSELIAVFVTTNFAESDKHPIVYCHNSLYLRRYYCFEKQLQTQLNERRHNFNVRYNSIDIAHTVNALFTETATNTVKDEVDWQKVAVANALNQGFSVIAGGPGTGKTYTVTKLLAALIQLNEQYSPHDDLNIALVAPTGKAAQRLSESLVNTISGFKSSVKASVLAKIPTQAQTIHRLLGVIPNQAHFRHHEKNVLACDILLVDEVSMVDLPLMQRLLAALPENTQIILLGDADQLPSVEVGCVLSDVAPHPHPGFSEVNQDYLAQVTGYSTLPIAKGQNADHCVFLTKSRRFDGKGGIGLLAQAVIAGDSETSWKLLHDELHSQTLNITPPLSEIAPLDHILPLVKQYYAPLFSAKNIQDCFTAFAQFRFLCATRKGTFGVDNINNEVERYLLAQNITSTVKALYHAKPIMISTNHYGLGLYNGDVGITWLTEAGYLQVAFEKENGEYLWVLPSKLPEYESVYAMTIHKTQGSEFSHVSMLLPEQAENKLLSRELLYTAITRAKNRLSITCNKLVWAKSVKAKVKRFSHLSLF